MNDSIRRLFAEVAKEIDANPDPASASVLCVYDPTQGEPSRSDIELAARGRRVAVVVLIPDNGRDRASGTVPRFHVDTQNAGSWTWTPPTGSDVGP